MTLPVQAILPELKNTLSQGRNVVLQAPPGAGKTTCLPLALLDAKWLSGRKIILLQPRRLAARAAARRMAATLGESVGHRVGYRIQFENRAGPATRIEVVTEAVLTRKLQRDPELADTGLVVFDEFHERHIHSDLGLALCSEVQAQLRPDLRIMVMSATLAGDVIARILDRARKIACEGRQYPVATHYLERPAPVLSPGFIAAEIARITAAREGSLLVFLPGAGEIRQVAARLRSRYAQAGLTVTPLFGDLPGKEQDLAIKPCPPGRRKVVLATSIAETSLTIEGINIVVDAGQMRVPRFQPGSLMTALETVRVSKASADQRRGRAGRTGPGHCYRLWTRHDQVSLMPYNKPEILNTDLGTLALELACWGTQAVGELAWLDPPPEAAMRRAWDLLQSIGAVDARCRATRHGRRINELGVHPRLGHMILQGAAMGAGRVAAEMAALISRRDMLAKTRMAREADIRIRLELLRGNTGRLKAAASDDHVRRRTRQLAERWRKMAGQGNRQSDSPDDAGKILALAYPDRIGKLRTGSRHRYLLSGGRGALLPEQDPLCGSPLIVVARTDGKPENAGIYLAAPVGIESLEAVLGDRIQTRTRIAWNRRERAVSCREQRLIGRVVLEEKVIKNADKTKVCKCLLKGIREAGMDCLPFRQKDHDWMARVRFLRDHQSGSDTWPDLSPAALMANLEAWLQPYLEGYRSLAALKKLPMKTILSGLLDWEQMQRLDELAPRALTVPSGSRIRLDYTTGDIPVLAVRLQEMFGSGTTPSVLGGTFPVMLHLLSPAGRPVQITRDLAGFWQGAYADVKKEMKGRYPKHYWPDNPLEATATRKVKPKRKRT